MMKATFEHIGVNVADKEAFTRWYTENLGVTVIRDVPGKMSFLADSEGQVIMEVYSNPDAPVLDFKETHFLTLHVAFEADDPENAARALVAAGARIVDPAKKAGEDILIMLKDPFGLSLQLIKRGTRMRRE